MLTDKKESLKMNLCLERLKINSDNKKNPITMYILGVLTNTTACDQHWEGDEILKSSLTLSCNCEIEYT